MSAGECDWCKRVVPWLITVTGQTDKLDSMVCQDCYERWKAKREESSR